MNMRLYYLDSAMIPSSAGCARRTWRHVRFSRLGIGSVWPVRPPVCGNRWGDRPVRGRGFDSAWLRRVVFVCGYARCRRTCTARSTGRAVWSADVERHGTTLIAHSPVALDFGACGKGYLVDLLAGMLGDGAGHPQPIQYVIDAGGDLLVHTDEPITIALEDPADPANAVGAVEISQGAFCASSPSRRHWSDAAGHQLHHLLNAIDGLPVDDVAATWVAVTPPSSAITTKTSTHASNASTTANRDTDDSSNTVAAHVPVTLADGLATALFTTSATQLRAHFPFECAILNANRTAAQSPNFPGGFFTH